jgi:hypothetical protein
MAPISKAGSATAPISEDSAARLRGSIQKPGRGLLHIAMEWLGTGYQILFLIDIRVFP